MSFIIKDKIFVVEKRNVFLGIFIFLLAALGFFLPSIYGGNIKLVEAVTFSDTVNVATINDDNFDGGSSSLDMIYVNGLYYLVFSSSTDGTADNISIYLTTSTDGESWGSPVSIFTDGGDVIRQDETIDLEYNEYGNYFGIIFYYQDPGGRSIIFSTSSDAYTWSELNVIVSTSDSPGENMFLDFASESDLIGVAYLNQDTNLFEVATSSDGSSWSTSTITDFSSFENTRPIGMEISGSSGSEVIHAMYIMDEGVGGSIKMDIVYATSSDFGSSWSTTTIASELNDAAGDEGATSSTSADGVGLYIGAAMDVDAGGLPGVIYFDPQEVDYGDWDEIEGEWVKPTNVTTTVIYSKQNIDSSWTSTTLDTVSFTISDSEPYASAINFNGSGVAAFYVGNNKTPVIQVNDGDGFEKTVKSNSINETGNSAIIFDDSDRIVSAAWTSGTQLSFCTADLSYTSGENLLTNGSLDDWTNGIPDGWSTTTQGEAGSIVEETTIVKTASGSSAKLVTGDKVLYQVSSGLNEGDSYALSIWSYAEESNINGLGSFLIFNGILGGDASQFYNWDDQSWVDISGGNYANGIEIINNSKGVWEEFNNINLEKNLTAPASGKIGLYLINGGSQGEDVVYFDDVFFAPTTTDFLYDGNLSEVDTDTKTKLFWVNDVYYLFYSSTENNEYYLYLTTSTRGTEGSWSEPIDIFENSIKPNNPSGTIEGNGLFAIDYNEENGYFGAAIFASGTTEIWFASSTDGMSWATSTVVNNVSNNENEHRVLDMDFSDNGMLVLIGYNHDGFDKKFAYSSNSGSTWSVGSIINDDGVLVGINIVGDAPPYTLHAGFSFYKGDEFFIYYASSTDSGANWTTTTVDDISFYNESEEKYLGFYNPVSFSVDSSGNPAFNYHALVDLDSVGVVVTSSIRYAHKENGVWVTSTVDTISLSDYVECLRFVPSDLFFHGDVPVLGYVGDEFEPKYAVNTSTFLNDSSTSTAMDCISDMGVTYDSTNKEIGLSFVSGAKLYFVTSSMDLPVLEEGGSFDGNLPVVDEDSKTKLLWVNNVYYLAFSSSTGDIYNIYLTTSTDGSGGSWSEPQVILEGIKHDGTMSGFDGIFAFNYNEHSDYFAMAGFSTTSDVIMFATSSDAGDWSNVVTFADVSGSSVQKRLDIAFADNYEAVGIVYSKGDYDSVIQVSYSTDEGSTWSSPTQITVSNRIDWSNIELTGSAVEDAVLNVAYFTSSGNLFFASSTNLGTNWSTTTIDSGLIYDVHTLAVSSDMFKDSNENLGIMYYDLEEFTGPSTSSLYFAYKDDSGWTTTTVEDNITMTLSSYPEGGAGIFYDTDKPIIAYFSNDLYPAVEVSTTTDPFNFSDLILVTSSPADVSSELSIAYSTTTEELALVYVTGGQLTFVTSSLEMSEAGGSAPVAPSGVSDVVATSSIYFSWTDNSSDETGFVVEKTTDGVNYVTVTSTAANVTSTDVTGLYPNTQYLLRVAAFNTYGTSTFATSSADYTNPIVPGVPVTSNISTSSITLTWDNNDNGASTIYEVYNFTNSTSITTTTGTTYNVTDLENNTSYQFSIRAQYLSSSTLYTSYSSPSTVTTTLSVTPAGITLSTTTQAVTEGGTTDTYTVVLNTQPTNDVVITLSSTADVTTTPATLTFTSANWNTAQTVTTTAVDDSTDETSPETATTTFAVASSDSNYNNYSLSPVISSVTDNDEPSTPEVGVTLSKTTASVAEDNGTDTYTIVLNTEPSSTVFIELSETSADFSLSTTSISFTTANWDTPQTITITAVSDSNVEGTETASITHSASSTDENYDGIIITNVVVTITDNDHSSVGGGGGIDITPPTNISLLINNGVTTTYNTEVTLKLGAIGASYMMISNTSNFASVLWENFSTSKFWSLTSGEGIKYVYVKYKDYSGNISNVVSSSIFLANTSTTSTIVTTTENVATSTTPVIDVENCPLTLNKIYKSIASSAVYYITNDCTKRAFTRSDIFFTYFNSWDEVEVVGTTELNSIPNDSLGFMPYGPKYDPKYGALVKIVKDPKVYLLLGNEKYWITSELVFNALNYKWDWIEDVDERLLDKYLVGSEISYINHHPNYTLIKYIDSNKVYRLEPDPSNNTKQVKRWIVDENTFKSLNFRWDRIVTIDDTEVYEDGSNLQIEQIKLQLTQNLYYGNTGKEVETLQAMLTQLGFLKGKITGTYDVSTVLAVRAFQVANGLSNVGNVGPQTRALLNSKF